MDTKKKQLIFLVGSIFVAVIFLTSYAAFSNNNSGTTSTSTIKSSQTFFAVGNANAVIFNYSDIAVVALSNSSNSIRDNVNTTMSQLESNGSLQDYIYSGSNNTYQVVLSTISAYGLQQLLYSNATITNSVSVGSTASILLPSTVTLHYTNVPITISPPNRNDTVYLKNVKRIGTVINVSISALLGRNGSVYNNQFRVSYSG